MPQADEAMTSFEKGQSDIGSVPDKTSATWTSEALIVHGQNTDAPAKGVSEGMLNTAMLQNSELAAA